MFPQIEGLYDLRQLAPFLRERGADLARAITKRKPNAAWGYSIRTTTKCQQDCDGCYWRVSHPFGVKPTPRLSDEAMVEFHRQQRLKGFVFCAELGGDPLAEPELLKKTVEENVFTWVVTNGMVRLPPLPRTVYWLSCDAATAAAHDKQRRTEGAFEKLMSHLAQARADGIRPILVHSTIGPRNSTEPRGILKLFAQKGLVEGVLFSLLTPNRSDPGFTSPQQAGVVFPLLTPKRDDPGFTRAQQAGVVEDLLRLKDEFGGLLMLTSTQIERYHPDHTATLTPATCLSSTMIPPFDELGQPIPQCTLGRDADCSRCGCAVDTLLKGPKENSTFLDFLAHFGPMLSIRSSTVA